MVGRFVKQEQVRLFQKRHRQRHTTSLTAGQLCNRRIIRRQYHRVGNNVHQTVGFPAVAGIDLILQDAHFFQKRVHVVSLVRVSQQFGNLVEPRDHIQRGLDRRSKIFTNGFIHFQLRFLGDILNRHLGRQPGLAVNILIDPSHNLEQRTLTGPVFADNADLSTIIKRQRNILKYISIAVTLADIAHLKHKLWRHFQSLMIND